jgi:hypothetical protein
MCGGLHPIARGDISYRLVTKAIIRHSNRRDFLLPRQFGVGSKGGVEPWYGQSNELWAVPRPGNIPT